MRQRRIQLVDLNETMILYETFCAIAESYTSILYLDTVENRAYPIRLDDYSRRYEEELMKGPSMDRVMEVYTGETVYKEDVEGLMRLADRDHVVERLKSENPLFYTYRAIHKDKILYYRLKIVPIENGQKIVYGFENFDSQMRSQLAIKAEQEMQMTLINGLSREYMSVWYLDGKSRKVTLIQNNGQASENGAPVRIGKTMVDYHFSMQKYYGSFVEPEDFDRMMRATSYDALVENAGENDLYRVNYIRINPDKSKSHFQVCYAKIVDNSGIANFVFGFRNTDGAVD